MSLLRLRLRCMDPLSQLSKQHATLNEIIINKNNDKFNQHLLNELDDLDNKVLISVPKSNIGA